jgi:hypothetical protein
MFFWPIPGALPWLSYPGWPICSFHAARPVCPVLVVLSWLSCPACPVLIVLFCLSCSACPLLYVMFWLSWFLNFTSTKWTLIGEFFRFNVRIGTVGINIFSPNRSIENASTFPDR